jgi:hypothetical protein
MLLFKDILELNVSKSQYSIQEVMMLANAQFAIAIELMTKELFVQLEHVKHSNTMIVLYNGKLPYLLHAMYAVKNH